MVPSMLNGGNESRSLRDLRDRKWRTVSVIETVFVLFCLDSAIQMLLERIDLTRKLVSDGEIQVFMNIRPFGHGLRVL